VTTSLLDELTPQAGRARRHALVERMLRDVLDVPWSRVHREADKWGDDVSDEVAARIAAMLDDPGTCPHGNPIPGSANVPDQSDAIRLIDCGAGPAEVVRVTEELEDDDEAMQLLDAAGVTPGRDIEVRQRHDDGSVDLAGGDCDLTVPGRVATRLYVRQR
jgi:DtxR family Mn-dependent transcriptional regulator